MKSLSVNFSGSVAVYPYTYAPALGTPQIGQRVVVPTKIKSDGTVTLTIAHVVEVHDTVVEGAVKPIIALLQPEAIEQATAVCVQLEKEADAAVEAEVEDIVTDVKKTVSKARGDKAAA